MNRPRQTALDAGRMLIISPFGPDQGRMTAHRAEQRNRVILALATELLILHAASGNRTASVAGIARDLGLDLIQPFDFDVLG